MNLTDTKSKHKCLYGAVWLWCIANGYNEIPRHEFPLDAVFENEAKRIGFVFEIDRSDDDWLALLKNAEQSVSYLYLVTDDNCKCRTFAKTAPEYCGIFCVSNPYGLGTMTQILKKATYISK